MSRSQPRRKDNPEQTSELEGLYLKVAKTLALIQERREPYASGHSERVSRLATRIALELGCPDELVRKIELAARLHDIGKIAIKEAILFKPDQLTTADWEEIKQHPAVAVEILRHLDCFSDLLPLIESHHEWYDGRGYPHNLKGEEIPLGARILAVADAYDALTSPRPYRGALGEKEALQIIQDGAGSQWDPEVVDAFFKVMRNPGY